MRGIQHIDMIFDDGTCPTMEYVRKFIGAAESVIANGGKIAVHCKAGLGRTGCLIGAHLIYTHGFTASECIGYMRMIRPGMVVCPQQHWLYLHQNEFRDWRHTMVIDSLPDEAIGGLYPLVPIDEYKQHQGEDISLDDGKNYSPITPARRRKISGQLKAAAYKAVPMESPGQPRKYRTTNQEVVAYVNSDDENTYDSIAQQQISSPKSKSNSTNNENAFIEQGEQDNHKSSHRRENNKAPFFSKTTTTTTSTTTTIASSPTHRSLSSMTEGGSIKMPKQRGSKLRGMNRLPSSNEKVIGVAGVRKISASKRNTSGI
ncbi:unnamed protein product [Ambrosiozyma monospora]|uniref:protein-tyrosine-phosphatase n=1 Tax=Ambrosiozyma monospora TaxID=43982 RepID=A0A9W7DM00_AMBMO|nr:unnamed protein product [Ambrosiozyma monospora]